MTTVLWLLLAIETVLTAVSLGVALRARRELEVARVEVCCLGCPDRCRLEDER